MPIKAISIHAPRMGGATVLDLVLELSEVISIHAPRMGARRWSGC